MGEEIQAVIHLINKEGKFMEERTLIIAVQDNLLKVFSRSNLTRIRGFLPSEECIV